MTVSFIDPGKEIRMNGRLGTLHMLGVHGGNSWKFIAVNEKQTKILTIMKSSVFTRNFEKLSKIVAQVQTLQVSGLASKL